MGSAEDEEAAVRAAIRAGDDAAFALLAEDARQSMPPHLLRYEGRDALAILFANYIQPDSIHYPGRLRLVPTAANRHPAAATYVRSAGDGGDRLVGLNVLEIEDGLVRRITSFGSQSLGSFGLAWSL
jgi:RNA polymerase sigma-70 factor (ECF subfamily)